jgi:glycosyltransferase involved in cell wall biosynthesis
MEIMIFLQDLGLGGVPRQVSMLAAHLIRKGHRVSVVALTAQDRDWKMVWDANVEVSVLLPKKTSGAVMRIARLARAAAALRSRVKRENCDVLYAIQGDLARWISWLATRGLSGTKLIWGIRGSGRIGNPRARSWKKSLPRRLCGWVSGTVPLTIANSQAGYASHRRHGNRAADQRVIDNGFDVVKFTRDAEGRARVRAEWNAATGKLIGVVGRLSRSKALDFFLEAAARLNAERNDLGFVLVGAGSDRGRVEALGERLRLGKKIIWAGARQDMPAVYSALDILCSASVGGEGFPNVVGEAMACGVPCVVTDVGDSARIVGELGVVVPPGDAEALARGLAATLDRLDGIDRGALRERIATRFSLQAMVDATEKALIEAAESRARPRLTRERVRM